MKKVAERHVRKRALDMLFNRMVAQTFRPIIVIQFITFALVVTTHRKGFGYNFVIPAIIADVAIVLLVLFLSYTRLVRKGRYVEMKDGIRKSHQLGSGIPRGEDLKDEHITGHITGAS